MARSEGIPVYKAPYEFDPQGALLNRVGANYAVVSRDNDLLWYGAERVIREVDRKECTVTMYTAEAIWQAANSTAQSKHAPFNKLVSLLGITGAAVCAAMVASDYNKVTGWTAVHALERLAQPKALAALKRERAAPAPSKAAPWGAPLPAAVVRTVLNAHRVPGHREITMADLPGMVTASGAYVDQIVSTPALVADTLHVTELPLSQALELGAVRRSTVEELPVPRAVPPACGVPRGHSVTTELPADAASGCPAVTVPTANAHSQGWLDAGGDLLDLVPVAKVSVAGAHAPRHLVPSMVLGGMLDPRRVSEGVQAAGSKKKGSVTMAELHLFLCSRCYTEFSQDNWAQLVKKCRQALATQAAVEEKHAPGTDLEPDDHADQLGAGDDCAMAAGPLVRCRTGVCAIEVLVKNEIFAAKHFAQYNHGGFELPDDGWTTDLNMIQAKHPYVSDQLVRNHWGVPPDASAVPRAIRRGVSHLQSMDELVEHAVHFSPFEDKPQLVASRMKVRASFKALYYFVTVIYECKDAANVSVPVAQRVAHANCQPTDGGDPCQASGFGHAVVYDRCSHISAVVQAALNLVRPDGVVGVKVPGTAALCKWNNPGEGATFAPGTRLASVVFTQPIYQRDAKPRRTCMSEESNRGDFNPILDPHHALNPANAETMRLRGVLYQSLEEDFGQEFPEHTGGN